MDIYHTLTIIALTSLIFYGLYRISKYAFFLNMVLLSVLIGYLYYPDHMIRALLYLGCPLLFINTVFYVFLHKTNVKSVISEKYQVNFKTNSNDFKIENIKRGTSIIGSAGSGKTESVVYGSLNISEKKVFVGSFTTTKILNLPKWHIRFLKMEKFLLRLFPLIKSSIGSYCAMLFRE